MALEKTWNGFDPRTEPDSLADTALVGKADGSGYRLPLSAFVSMTALAFATQAIALENKSINFASNTVSGTKAQFNAALSDGDFRYVGVNLAISEITGLQSALDAKANSSVSITGGTGLTGGGTLAANRTIALSSTSLASLAKADSAVQPSALGDLATVNFPATPIGNVLNDLGNWVPQSGGGGGGTVTSVAASGGTTGFGFTGGPITSSGTLTLTISNATTARSALGLGTIATLAAPVGDVVGTTGAQTLSGKTLTGPVVNGYTERVVPDSGTAFSPSLAAGAVFFYTTTGNATITMPSAVSGKSFVAVVQYGGAHTLTWAGTAIRWPDGTEPTPTSVSGKRDTFPFICVDGTTWQPGGMNI